MGRCTNCKRHICLSTDLIFIDKTSDIEQLLNANDIDWASTPGPSVDEIKSPKLQDLLMIIRGEASKKRINIELNMSNLLLGRVDKPLGPGTQIKVLIFAGFNETLNMIKNLLTEQNISFLHLKGDFNEMANIIERFRSDIHVLLVNSHQNCSGICLEFATDLVFFHKIIDKNIESQVIGRIQRIGRKNNARIHYLAYFNEARLI